MERFHSPLIELKTQSKIPGDCFIYSNASTSHQNQPKLNNDCGNICLIIIRRETILHFRPRAFCGLWWFQALRQHYWRWIFYFFGEARANFTSFMQIGDFGVEWWKGEASNKLWWNIFLTTRSWRRSISRHSSAFPSGKLSARNVRRACHSCRQQTSWSSTWWRRWGCHLGLSSDTCTRDGRRRH